MKKNQFHGKLLSREQQKKINGGLAGCTLRLLCMTSSGGDFWNMSAVTGNPTTACQNLWSGYGSNVHGSWELDCGVIAVVEINV